MVRDQVEKTMRKALLRFAEQEGKPANNIAFFIHTKPTDEQPELEPKYFYAVDGVPVQENGQLKDLRFTQDILGKKIDMLGMSFLAANFLSKHFATISEELEADPRTLYVMITCKDEKAENLAIALYKGNKVVRNMELDEIFGE
jgi:hypothetical protein